MNYIKNKPFNLFYNSTFDKGRLKSFINHFYFKNGEYATILLVDNLKNIGYKYATKAGISLGIEDFNIPKSKISLLYKGEVDSYKTIHLFKSGDITGVERYSRLLSIWHTTSEKVKNEVVSSLKKANKLSSGFNPLYMIINSGARGNISQVRQLVGMRGLMANTQGSIIDFPIRSNFREGLTLTEYLISSYGARKGIVDTALRTATAGFLTRRLVDVAQNIIISTIDCKTNNGIYYSLNSNTFKNTLIGRVLAKNIYILNKDNNTLNNTLNSSNKIIGYRNTVINPNYNYLLNNKSKELYTLIFNNKNKESYKENGVYIRSPLTCTTYNNVCSLCYGWSLANNNLVSIGEAVGIIAAQSIGEPGTQLTMRTFHTGGIFAGDINNSIIAGVEGIVKYLNPIAGNLIRTGNGDIAFLTKGEGYLSIINIKKEIVKNKIKIAKYSLLYIKNGGKVKKNTVIAIKTSIKGSTDNASLTLKSDIEGSFITLSHYSFNIPPSSNNNNLYKQQSNKNTVKRSINKLINNKETNKSIDKINKAWDWGYAWVLAGTKVTNINNNIYTIKGDILNKGSYISKVNINPYNKNYLKAYYNNGINRIDNKKLKVSIPSILDKGLIYLNKRYFRNIGDKKGYGLLITKNITKNSINSTIVNNNKCYITPILLKNTINKTLSNNNNINLKANNNWLYNNSITLLHTPGGMAKHSIGVLKSSHPADIQSSVYKNITYYTKEVLNNKKINLSSILHSLKSTSKVSLNGYNNNGYYNNKNLKTKTVPITFNSNRGELLSVITNSSIRDNKLLLNKAKDSISISLDDCSSFYTSLSKERLSYIIENYNKNINNKSTVNNSNRYGIKLGQLKSLRDKLDINNIYSNSGQIIHINKNKVTIRKGIKYNVSPNTILHYNNGEIVDKNKPVLTYSYKRMSTGDIVQGIPKVEQLLEGRYSKNNKVSLSILLKALFKYYYSIYSLEVAALLSIIKISKIIVKEISEVYRSQGVNIADKHIEIIVKRMLSKVIIINSNNTGFIRGELVNKELVDKVNKYISNKPDKSGNEEAKVIYRPILLGISRISIESNSFLSAASFGHTTSVLSNAAISGKKDFLKGIKENVILANLIPAGTGYINY